MVQYSLSEVLSKPLFNVEFGDQEHDFDVELMPMELGGLFTWKPNMATCENYTTVEWNAASTNLSTRNREIALYNDEGSFIQELKCDEDPFSPVQILMFEHHRDTYCIVANKVVELYRVVKFYLERTFEKAYFINKFRMLPDGACHLRCSVAEDAVLFSYNTSREDTTLKIVSLTFDDIINHAREEVKPCQPFITLDKIDTPTLISTPRELLVIHRDGNINKLVCSTTSLPK